MWQNAAIESVPVTVQELLGSSRLQQYDISAVETASIQDAQYFVWAVIALIFFCLIFRNQTFVYLSWAGNFLRTPVKRTYYDTSPSVRYGLPLSMLLLIPLAAYLVYGTSTVEAPYYLILAIIAGYFVLRFLIMAGIAYVSGKSELAAVLNRSSSVGFMIVTALFCILLIVGMYLPGIYPVITGEAAFCLAGVLAFLYLVELLRIFFSFREPLLLTILYLCTLEILPAALAVACILRF